MNNNFKILYEDKELIVCYKPHGIATQSRNVRVPDMERLLLNHLARTSSTSGRPYLAVIHRLDQPVAGILVFAKTKKAATELNRQLNSKGFGKHYLALVDGIPAKSEGALEDYMVKDAKTNTSHICQQSTPQAKPARLHYQVLGHPTDTTSLLEVVLDTGRHHQIRVQLSHMGCPIQGDTKYNPATSGEKWQDIKLCAYKLEFVHPVSKKQMSFEVDADFI